MKYNFCYKYYELKVNELSILIELNYDNTLGKGYYGAHTNVSFKDEEGNLGLAAGSGKTEVDALKMCLKEINDFSRNNNAYNLNLLKQPLNVTLTDLLEVNLPYHITIKLGKNYTTVYLKKQDNNLIVLTDKTKLITPIKSNVIHTLKKIVKQIKQSNNNNFTKEYLEQNGFYPTFNSLLQ